MSTAFKVIQGQYFRDLLAQPAALDATFGWLSDGQRWAETQRFVSAKPWKRIVLTGMGSSFHTLHPLNLALIAGGFNPVMMETSELIHYGMRLCDEDALIVIVSQSGRSAEILRLLELNGHSTMLGVTNTPDSPLATRSHFAICTQAGEEFSVSCKTYVAGMMALQWLAGVFIGSGDTSARLRPAARLVRQYLDDWQVHTGVLARELGGMRHVFLTGRGASLAAAGTGALIIKEACHFHAEGLSSAAFRHGPMEALQDNMFTAVFSGDQETCALNRRLLSDLKNRGRACAEIGSESAFPPFRLPDCDPLVRPILEILPAEMLTLALAAVSQREAGFFEHATKITDTE